MNFRSVVLFPFAESARDPRPNLNLCDRPNGNKFEVGFFCFSRAAPTILVYRIEGDIRSRDWIYAIITSDFPVSVTSRSRPSRGSTLTSSLYSWSNRKEFEIGVRFQSSWVLTTLARRNRRDICRKIIYNRIKCKQRTHMHGPEKVREQAPINIDRLGQQSFISRVWRQTFDLIL